MRRSFKRHVGLNGVYNGDNEFMAGESIMFSGPADKIPAGYLIEDGAEVGRVAYATLFATIGTTYGAGDGATTFNLPDSRGEVWRGLDLSAGRDAGRVIGSKQGDAGRNLTGAWYLANSWQGTALGTTGSVSGAFISSGTSTNRPAIAREAAGTGVSGPEFGLGLDASRQWPTANEFRMRNIAKIPLIKY